MFTHLFVLRFFSLFVSLTIHWPHNDLRIWAKIYHVKSQSLFILCGQNSFGETPIHFLAFVWAIVSYVDFISEWDAQKKPQIEWLQDALALAHEIWLEKFPSWNWCSFFFVYVLYLNHGVTSRICYTSGIIKIHQTNSHLCFSKKNLFFDLINFIFLSFEVCLMWMVSLLGKLMVNMKMSARYLNVLCNRINDYFTTLIRRRLIALFSMWKTSKFKTVILGFSYGTWSVRPQKSIEILYNWNFEPTKHVHRLWNLGTCLLVVMRTM